MSLPTNQISSIIGVGGGDYLTLAAWEADLDDAAWGQDYIAEITGLTGDNSTINFYGINPNGYKLIIRAASGQEADGSDAAGAMVDSQLALIENNYAFDDYIENIELTGSAQINFGHDTASDLTVTKCVFRDLTTHALYAYGAGTGTVCIGVSLFRNIPNNAAVYLNDSDVIVKSINNTVYDTKYGLFEQGGVFNPCTNCVSMENSSGDFYSAVSNQSYNCSSDTTATGAGSLTSKTYTDQWSNPANDDFTVKDTNADIYHAGVQITGESWFPATDLAGTSWNNPPSIGCFEYAAGGGPIQKDVAGTLPAMSGTLSRKVSLKRSIGGSI